jgi:hypothetical protein
MNAVTRLTASQVQRFFAEIQTGREDVLALAQTGKGQHVAVAFLADVIHDRRHRDATDEFAAIVDHRGRHQLVALEGLRRLVGHLPRPEAHGVGQHDLGHELVRVVDEDTAHRQHALQDVAPVDNEELVGVVGQFVEAAQVAQHHLERDVLADGDHLEIHQRPDGFLGVRHGSTQLLALLHRERLEDVLDDLLGEVGCEVGDLVGIELLGGGDQLLGLHVRDERRAHRVGDLEQDLAVAIGLDEVPDRQPVVRGAAPRG